MSSKKNTFETDILELIFNNTNIANIGDATGVRGSSNAGSLYIALYTITPTDSAAGTECAYTSYARVAVARSAGGWTISGDTASNTAAITFPTATGGTETVNGVAILTASTSGDMLYYGTLTTPISVVTGVTPSFPIGALTIQED